MVTRIEYVRSQIAAWERRLKEADAAQEEDRVEAMNVCQQMIHYWTDKLGLAINEVKLNASR